MVRVGIGYDVHKLARGRDLIIGGVRIKSEMGLEGHSDADVLIHAVIDALLGAAALGDIGVHFPDTDETWKGADSAGLLAHARNLIEDAGFAICNIDATLALEKPKLEPHIMEMRARLSTILGLAVDQVSVKATTSEKLGFVGRGQGAVAYAICAIENQ